VSSDFDPLHQAGPSGCKRQFVYAEESSLSEGGLLCRKEF